MHTVDLIYLAIRRSLESVPKEAAANYAAALKEKKEVVVSELEQKYPLLCSYPLDSRNEIIELPCEPIEAVCALTGETRLCVPLKKGLSGNFTEWNILKVPSSDYISVEAYFALKFRWERFSSWLCCGDDFVRADKNLVRGIAQHGITFYGQPHPWALFVTTSYKKHGALRAPVNSAKCGRIAFDDAVIDCSNSDMVIETYDQISNAFERGASRNDLETLRPSSWTMKALRIDGWRQYEAWARGIFEKPLYQFCVYLLPAKEKKEKE